MSRSQLKLVIDNTPVAAQAMIDDIKKQAKHFLASGARVHERVFDPTAYQCDRCLLTDTWAELRRTESPPEWFKSRVGFIRAMAWMLTGLVQLRQAKRLARGVKP
jgi:hypothetical protein